MKSLFQEHNFMTGHQVAKPIMFKCCNNEWLMLHPSLSLCCQYKWQTSFSVCLCVVNHNLWTFESWASYGSKSYLHFKFYFGMAYFLSLCLCLVFEWPLMCINLAVLDKPWKEILASIYKIVNYTYYGFYCQLLILSHWFHSFGISGATLFNVT